MPQLTVPPVTAEQISVWVGPQAEAGVGTYCEPILGSLCFFFFFHLGSTVKWDTITYLFCPVFSSQASTETLWRFFFFLVVSNHSKTESSVGFLKVWSWNPGGP